MSLPVLDQPLEERWDCHGCGHCCRGTRVPLMEADLRRLRDQRWDRHPDYRGTRITWRRGFRDRGRVLARRPDDTCIFLSPEKRCRIHEEFGEAAKPLYCRLYPFLLLPAGDRTLLTVRRSCPSAAAELGRPLAEHLPLLEELWEEKAWVKPGSAPPPVHRGLQLDWAASERVLDAVDRLMRDRRRPLASRFLDGLELCRRLEKLSADPGAEELGELLESFLATRGGERGEEEPTRPHRDAAQILRQMGLEYLLYVPWPPIEARFRRRLRVARAALAFHRGRGPVPRIARDQPPARFEELDRPLGDLPAEIAGPFEAYFVAAVVSRQYALHPKRELTIVESFQLQACSFVVALWMLRLFEVDRDPAGERLFDVISAIDWCHDTEAWADRYEHERVERLVEKGWLDQLVVWLAR